jgi:endonuclease YncB( thermonuclease family)
MLLHRSTLLMIALLTLLIAMPVHAAAPLTGRVVHVSDGDTVVVLTSGREEVKIRLHGIDCPEAKQPFGQAAKRQTLALAGGKDVTVLPLDTDRYGRTIGEVFLSDGTSLNKALVSMGYAWWYQRYAPRDAELAALEAEARRARRGLWADANPAPPWEWRKAQRADVSK